MIYLITGAIGTGKTMYVVEQLMKIADENKKLMDKGQHEKVRQIYSNISGLKLDHLPLPDDWRTCPKNSVFAIDECHKISIYQPNRKKLHDDERIIALNESRHEGCDFYFITQAPSYIHNHIKGLVNQHFHFHNPMGLKLATVFMWRHGNTTTPDSQAAKNIAENQFTFTYRKEVYDMYHSIEEDAQHTKKTKIPRKVILWSLAPILLLGFIGYLLTKPQTVGNLTGDTFQNAGNAVNSLEKSPVSSSTATINDKTLETECRKGINVEKPECVAYFDKLTKNKESVSDNQTVQYNINKPFESEQQIQQSITYQVSAKPVFSGCMKQGVNYVAYTQQGTIIRDISQDDCKRLIDQSDRPFNYFAKEQFQQQNQNNDQTFQSMQQSTQLSRDDLAKFEEAKRLGLI